MTRPLSPRKIEMQVRAFRDREANQKDHNITLREHELNTLMLPYRLKLDEIRKRCLSRNPSGNAINCTCHLEPGHADLVAKLAPLIKESNDLWTNEQKRIDALAEELRRQLVGKNLAIENYNSHT